MKDMESNLEFVVTHFRTGAFRSRPGTWATGGKTGIFFLRCRRRRHMAAAVAGGFLLAASAFAAYYAVTEWSGRDTATQPAATGGNAPHPLDSTMSIEFDGASLQEIVVAIENNYGVKLKNVPQTDKKLTLSFEGDCEGIVEMLNILLGSHMEI